jgi:hypothetical protein
MSLLVGPVNLPIEAEYLFAYGRLHNKLFPFDEKQVYGNTYLPEKIFPTDPITPPTKHSLVFSRDSEIGNNARLLCEIINMHCHNDYHVVDISPEGGCVEHVDSGRIIKRVRKYIILNEYMICTWIFALYYLDIRYNTNNIVSQFLRNRVAIIHELETTHAKVFAVSMMKLVSDFGIAEAGIREILRSHNIIHEITDVRETQDFMRHFPGILNDNPEDWIYLDLESYTSPFLPTVN